MNVQPAAPLSAWRAAMERLGHLNSLITRSRLRRSAALLLFALWFMLAPPICCILHCHFFAFQSSHAHHHATMDHATQTPYLCFHGETQHQPGPLPPPSPVSEAVLMVSVSVMLLLLASCLSASAIRFPSTHTYAPPSPPPKAA